MKTLLILITFLSVYPTYCQASSKPCTCKCVVKDDDDKYVLQTGVGTDRETAGNDLKKNLGKKKCELSPDCKGDCYQ